MTQQLTLEDAATLILSVGEVIKHFGRPVTYAEQCAARVRKQNAEIDAINATLPKYTYIRRAYSRWADRPYILFSILQGTSGRRETFHATLASAAAKARKLAATVEA
jgi:hypothetical protein